MYKNVKKTILVLGIFFLIVLISNKVSAVETVNSKEEIKNAIQNNTQEIVLGQDVYLDETIEIPNRKEPNIRFKWKKDNSIKKWIKKSLCN